MLIVKGKEYSNQFDTCCFVVDNIDGIVSPLVQVGSGLDCMKYRSKLSGLLEVGMISDFHYNELIKNMNLGVIKEMYFTIDSNINTSLLDKTAIVEYVDDLNLGIDFEETDTLEIVIQKIVDAGYYYTQEIKDYLNE